MITRFNKAQLERNMLNSLEQVVAVLQSENEAEIEVSALEFPNKLSVKLDKGPMFLIWDAEKKSYSGSSIPEPEPEPESKIDTFDLPGQKPEPVGISLDLDMAGNVIPNSDQSMIIPAELAQRTYDVVKDNLRMSPGQRKEYHETLCNLWLKEV